MASHYLKGFLSHVLILPLLSSPAPLSASACKQRPGLSHLFRFTVPSPAQCFIHGYYKINVYQWDE